MLTAIKRATASVWRSPGVLLTLAGMCVRLDGSGRELSHFPAGANYILGLNFDVGHAFCVREDLPRAIAKLAPHIRHYHLEDIAASRVHHHLVPGEGAIDFAATLRAIRAIGYQGWIAIELYPYVDDPDMAARTALARVRAILSETNPG